MYLVTSLTGAAEVLGLHNPFRDQPVQVELL